MPKQFDESGLFAAILAIVQFVADILVKVGTSLKAVVKWLVTVVLAMRDTLRVLGEAVRAGFETVFRALKHLLGDIIRGRFAHLWRDYLRLKARLDEWYQRHFRWLIELRRLQQRWLEQSIFPLLNLLQRLRQILVPFRLLGFRFASALDRKIGDIEGRAVRNALVLRRQMNRVGVVLTLILDPVAFIRRNPLFYNLTRGADSLFRGLFGRGLASFLGTTPSRTPLGVGARPFASVAGELDMTVRGVPTQFLEIERQALGAFQALDRELGGA